jgi:diguanylate cyclase (GGDEF)-like protein
MTQLTLRVLLAEDSPPDAEMALRELKRAGLRVAHRIVDSEEPFVQALRAFGPDVILSDFSMPGFDGMEALRLARDMVPETPFIFVSGTLGEEYAVRALKNGAWDYVLKTNLVRLPASVERATVEAEAQRERRRTATELEIARRRLQEREAGLTQAQHMAKLAHVITGKGGFFKTWSDNLPQLLGIEPTQMPRSIREWLDLVHPDDREGFRTKTLDSGTTRQRGDIDYRLRHGSGAWIHLREVIELVEADDTDGEERWFNTLQDVTEHKLAEGRIKRLNRVHAVLSGINSLIVRAPKRDELFKEASRIAVEAGQLRMAWLSVYDRKAQLLTPVAWHGHEDGFLRLMALSMTDPAPEGRGGLVRRAVREKRPVIINNVEEDSRFGLRNAALERGYRSGAVLPLLVAGEVIGVLGLFAGEPDFFDADEMRLLAELAGDISFALDHTEKAEKLHYLAYYDGPTGLANRTLFLERLTLSLHAAQASQTKLAVIASDLERFRAVNDSLGRQTGDLLLSQFSQRLAKTVSDSDLLARIGSDQFAIVIPAVKSELDCAHRLGDIAKGSFGEPFRLGEHELRISAKAGIALFPDHGADADTLLRNAESALKKSKQTGDRLLFYEQAMTQRVAESLSLETKLRRAVEQEEFVLHYQPRVAMQTRRIEGVEALIRWQAEGKLIPPARFIPLLEETGLILEVGDWALRRAVLEHGQWLKAGIPAPRVAVNVSAVQLRQRDFVPRVRRAIESGSMPPRIDVEITESMVMDDIQGNILKLRALRDLGLDVAIDDFGTGYSSLAYLAKLPVNALKIDRSFIITMASDANTMTLVSTIISLARSLRLKVVAEGVDSEEQASILRGLQCDEMQGYLFSKPLSSSDLVSLIARET